MPELKRKLVPLLGIAFVVAIIATGVFYGLFVGELKSATTRMSNQTILVATKDLSRGKILEASDLRVSHWAGDESLKDAFTRTEQVIGKPLLSNVSQNEPITESKLSASASNAAPMVPAGMRAVSVRIQESSGLMPFLRPGNRVDVQMVSSSNVLRTILENVEVLSMTSPAANVPGSLISILTLLVTPNEADRVALADATAKLRLLLRNPTDKNATGRSAIELNRVLQETHLQTLAAVPASSGSVPNVVAAAPSNSANRVDFEVRVISSSEPGMAALNAKFTTPRVASQLAVNVFRPGSNSSALLRQLADSKQLEILSSTSHFSVNERQVSAHPGSVWSPIPGLACGLFLNLQPTTVGKSLRLRVQPEVTVPNGSEVESRKMVADLTLDAATSFAITGWTGKNQAQMLLEKLFPSQWTNKENRELVIVVTPTWQQGQQQVAINRP